MSNPIEDTSTIYYIDLKGKVQDGNCWLFDLKHEFIDGSTLEELREVYWNSQSQQWELE